jgi:hypothetical protein
VLINTVEMKLSITPERRAASLKTDDFLHLSGASVLSRSRPSRSHPTLGWYSGYYAT